MIKIQVVIIIILLYFSSASISHAQDDGTSTPPCYDTVYNRDIRITIANGGSISFGGHFVALPNPDYDTNNVVFHIYDTTNKVYFQHHFLNFAGDSIFRQDPDGVIVFNGVGTQVFQTYSSELRVPAISINKPSGNIKITDGFTSLNYIEFVKGNLDLEGNIIDLKAFDAQLALGYEGELRNENNASRIIDSGEVIKWQAAINNIDSNYKGIGIGRIGGDIFDGNIVRRHYADGFAADAPLKKHWDLLTDQSRSFELIAHYIDNADFRSINGNTVPSSFGLWYCSLADIANGNPYHKHLGRSFSDTAGNWVLSNNSLVMSDEGMRLTIADTVCDQAPSINMPISIEFCEGDSVILNEGGPQQGYDFVWYGEDGLGNAFSLEPTYTVSDSGWVYLMLTNQYGCVGFDSIDIKMNPVPSPSFKTDGNIAYCLNEEVPFFYLNKDSVNTHLLSFQWNFGDLDFSNEKNPTHTYQNADTFHVNLRVENQYGCFSDTTRIIYIYAQPNFSLSSEDVCTGENTEFQFIALDDNTINNTNKIAWEYGNNQTDTIQQNSFSFNNENTHLHNHLYETGGIYFAKVTAYERYANCFSSIDSVPVEVFHSPIAAFDCQQEACENEIVDFIDLTNPDSSTISTYDWSFGDGYSSAFQNPAHQYSTEGSKTVNLTVVSTNNCSSSFSDTIIVHPLPEPNFEAENVCLNNPTFFNSTENNQVQSRLWDFADGNTSTEEDPTHQYSSDGVFNVNLLETTVYGCEASFHKEIEVYSLPHASFINDSVCLGDTSSFYNTTQDATEYLWEIEGLNISSSYNLEYYFQDTGEFLVNLIVEDMHTCKDTATNNTKVFAYPDSQFADLTDCCQGDQISFYPYNQNISNTYLWNFGDGSSSTQITPNFTYQDFGNFNVSLSVQNTHGCNSESSDQITVHSNPTANFNVDDVCFGELSEFNNLSNIAGSDSISVFTWDLGNGIPVQGTNTAYQFPQAGIFSVNLEAISSFGCSDQFSKDTYVHENPEISLPDSIITCANQVTVDASDFGDIFLWSTGSYGASAIFYQSGWYWLVVESNFGCKDSASFYVKLNSPVTVKLGDDRSECGSTMLDAGYFGSGTQYLWNTGNTDRFQEVETTGSYSVEVTDVNGCIDVDSVFIEVLLIPNVELGENIASCQGEVVTIDAGGGFETYSWSTGENTQAIDVSSSGIYSLTITNTMGCEDRDTISVIFNQNPVPCFNTDSVYNCGPQMLSAYNPFNQNCTYLWQDGSSEITYLANLSGWYSVEITMNNCSTIDSIYVTIAPAPEFTLGNDTSFCTGSQITLSSNLNNPTLLYSWSSGQNTPDITISEEGWYSLTVTNEIGCTETDNIIVVENPIPEALLNDYYENCGTVSLNAGNPGCSYIWNTGATSQVIDLENSGFYNVSVENQFGCVISDSTEVIVKPIPQIDLGDDIETCEGITSIIEAEEGFAEYLWSNGTNNSSLPVFNSGEYWLRVMNQEGCFAYDTINFIVHQKPIVELGGGNILCDYQLIELDAGNPGSSYQWSSNNGFASINQVVEIDQSGVYWVDVTSPEGCHSSDTATINQINYSILANFLIDSDVTVGIPFKAYELCVPTPDSVLWNFGNNISYELNPIYSYTMPGTHQISLTAYRAICSHTHTKTIEVQLAPRISPEDSTSFFNSNFIEILKSNMYPNPTRNFSTFEIELNNEADMLFVIFDLNGRLIYKESLSDVKLYSKKFNLSSLPKGIYIFKAWVADKSVTYKVIKI